jgi:hypothetical protein
MGQDTSWLSNHVCHGNSRQNSVFQKEKDPGADHRAKSSADLGLRQKVLIFRLSILQAGQCVKEIDLTLFSFSVATTEEDQLML